MMRVVARGARYDGANDCIRCTAGNTSELVGV